MAISAKQSFKIVDIEDLSPLDDALDNIENEFSTKKKIIRL